MSAHATYAGARALVLGGSGFIGSAVVGHLARAGAEVVATARDVERARTLLAERGVRCEVRACDLARPGGIAALLGALRPRVVFNLAGYGVDPAERDEVLARRLNTELVEELSDAVQSDATWPGHVLVHVGSALEFGTSSGDFADPWSCSPSTLYGRTKLAGSRRLREITLRRGVRALTARLFTVYGPGEHQARLVPTLLAAMRSRAPIPLTAGTQQRDFTFVSDVADGLLRMALLREPLPERALNLATGKLISVREFAQRAAHVFGIAPERLQFGALPTRAEEMAHEPVSIATLERLLRWRPETSIDQGLADTLAFERRRAAGRST